MKQSLSNSEIVTVAAYLLGAESTSADTEDIAVKANELAPGRFAWRKYPEHIDLLKVRSGLSDARKEKNGAYLLSVGSEGWMLTESGLDFARRSVGELAGVDLSRQPLSPRDRQRQRAERERMLASEAYQKFALEQTAEITQQEAESFFRLDDYVRGQARARKISRIVNTFSADPELGSLIALLADRVR